MKKLLFLSLVFFGCNTLQTESFNAPERDAEIYWSRIHGYLAQYDDYLHTCISPYVVSNTTLRFIKEKTKDGYKFIIFRKSFSVEDYSEKKRLQAIIDYIKTGNYISDESKEDEIQWIGKKRR